MPLVLDTSALSALMRRDPEARARAQARRPGELGLCSPAAAEIRYGLDLLPAESSRCRHLEAEYARLRGLLRWYDWTEPAAAAFGRIKAELHRSGTPIDDMDVAIASIAATHAATVATCNARHFVRIADLRVEDWRAE